MSSSIFNYAPGVIIGSLIFMKLLRLDVEIVSLFSERILVLYSVF